MGGRYSVSHGLLDNFFDETKEITEYRLAQARGRSTLGVDGFTDRRGRGTLNFTRSKPGIATYLSTKWFGRRQHTGENHGKEIEEFIGTSKEDIAVASDNTANMATMRSYLMERFPWLFYIKCCVHIFDLLIEGVAGVGGLKEIVAEYCFVVDFILRYGLIKEAFEDHRQSIYGPQHIGLRSIPSTRFSYADLMVFSVHSNKAASLALLDDGLAVWFSLPHSILTSGYLRYVQYARV